MNISRHDQLTAIAAISDPVRRSLYDLVSRSASPVSRDDAAAALGLARSTIAFHLDRLVEEGVLEVEYRRLSGKTGPGSGRPSKLYRRAAGELAVSFPPRRYELAGQLLAAAVEEADASGQPVRDVLSRVATETGRTLGENAGSLSTALEQSGYEPCVAPGGDTVLANCPFHNLAASHTDVICHANHALLLGVAEGAGDSEHEVIFDPSADHCCVRIGRRAQARA